MSDIFDGGPVHPVRVPIPGALHANGDAPPSELHTGLSKRELYALHCLPIARASFPDGIEGGWDGLCLHAFTIADAMLRAGTEPPTPQYRPLYRDEQEKLQHAERLANTVEALQKAQGWADLPEDLRIAARNAAIDVLEPPLPF